MMPENKLSTYNIFSQFLVPTRLDPLVDYEWGGIDVNNSSKGLNVSIWTCFYEDGIIKITNGSVYHNILTIENVTSVSLAFDFNMNVNITYVAGGISYLMWYDTSISNTITTNYGSDVEYPHISLDDNRSIRSSFSDIIFAYIKNKKLCMRIQRDRYLIEYILADSENITQIGMTKNYRFSFASKTLSTYDIQFDTALVDSRNKTIGVNKLDLLPLKSSYSAEYGDNVLRNNGDYIADLNKGKEGIINNVSCSFLLTSYDYDYLMAFYRLWQYNPKPFSIDLVLDGRPLRQYKANFNPGTMSSSVSGEMYKVATGISVIDNRFDKDAIRNLAESRNRLI